MALAVLSGNAADAVAAGNVPGKLTVMNASNGKQLWGSMVYSSAWDAGSTSDKGFYGFSVTAPDPTAYDKGSQKVANAGVTYTAGVFRYVNADYKYASKGSVSANLRGYKVDEETGTWTSTGSRVSLGVDMCGVETAFDRKTGKVYGVFYKDTELKDTEFGIADYDAKTRTTIGTATHSYVAIGLTSGLVMYGVASDGNLYKIDITTGDETLVGATGLTLTTADGTTYEQSGEIDQRDDTFYWAATDSEGKSGLYTIDLASGKATKVSDFPNNERFVGLCIPYPIAEDNAPGMVTNLKATFEKDNTTGTVSFKAPIVTYAGELLEGDVNYYVLAGTDTITGTASAGQKVSVTVTGSAKKNNTYTAWAANEYGAGPQKDVTAYVGLDTPKAMDSVQVTVDETIGSVKLEWKEPEPTHDGYLGDISYLVIRNSADTIATGLTTTTFSETLSVSELKAYRYAVVAQCGTNKTTAYAPMFKLGEYVNTPYTADFASEADFDIFTVIDANGDEKMWKYYAYGPNSAACTPNSSMDADDWLITPPIKSVAGHSYTVSFKASESNTKYTNKIEAKYGNDNTVAAMTGDGLAVSEVTTTDATDFSFTIKPESGDRLYIGFHKVSEKANGTLYLYDIHVIDNDATGISSMVAGNASLAGNVYTLDGRLVKANATSLEGMSKGMYIINNKKVVVK